MSYATAKGAHGEREAAEFFDALVKPDFHICRIGGVEFKKSVNAGDVGLLQTCKKHRYFGKRDKAECFLAPYFIEVKTQASPNIWGAIDKAEDDAELSGRVGVIGYFTKQGRGHKGDRLVCMRPEVFERIVKQRTIT